MKWNFIAFITLLCFYSCDDKSTPTIYPSKIGIDSAYKDLAKQDKPIVEDMMKEEEKTLKTSNKIVEKPSRIRIKLFR